MKKNIIVLVAVVFILVFMSSSVLALTAKISDMNEIDYIVNQRAGGGGK